MWRVIVSVAAVWAEFVWLFTDGGKKPLDLYFKEVVSEAQ